MTEQKQILIDLRPISTPRERCRVLYTGEIDSKVLDEAEEFRFDQLPVLDHSERLCGLIATEYARALSDSKKELDPVTDKLDLCEVDPKIELFELLDSLAKHRAVVYRQSSNAGQQHHEDWFAIVTISDLNRHPFRANFYPLFAELESALAELIDRTYENPWTWIPWTSTHTRPTIVGRWELDKRDGVDTTPLTGCELRDFLAIVSQSQPIQEQLRIEKTMFKKLEKALPELRNDIMHPVRSLVTSRKKVPGLRSQLVRLVELTETVVATVGSLEEEGKGRVRYRP